MKNYTFSFDYKANEKGCIRLSISELYPYRIGAPIDILPRPGGGAAWVVATRARLTVSED